MFGVSRNIFFILMFLADVFRGYEGDLEKGYISSQWCEVVVNYEKLVSFFGMMTGGQCCSIALNY